MDFYWFNCKLPPYLSTDSTNFIPYNRGEGIGISEMRNQQTKFVTLTYVDARHPHVRSLPVSNFTLVLLPLNSIRAQITLCTEFSFTTDVIYINKAMFTNLVCLL